MCLANRENNSNIGEAITGAVSNVLVLKVDGHFVHQPNSLQSLVSLDVPCLSQLVLILGAILILISRITTHPQKKFNLLLLFCCFSKYI